MIFDYPNHIESKPAIEAALDRKKVEKNSRFELDVKKGPLLEYVEYIIGNNCKKSRNDIRIGCVNSSPSIEILMNMESGVLRYERNLYYEFDKNLIKDADGVNLDLLANHISKIEECFETLRFTDRVPSISVEIKKGYWTNAGGLKKAALFGAPNGNKLNDKKLDTYMNAYDLVCMEIGLADVVDALLGVAIPNRAENDRNLRNTLSFYKVA